MYIIGHIGHCIGTHGESLLKNVLKSSYSKYDFQMVLTMTKSHFCFKWLSIRSTFVLLIDLQIIIYIIVSFLPS